ncbi:MAG: hypothetical protein QM831_03180 [Kofleriaceae bacterium]
MRLKRAVRDPDPQDDQPVPADDELPIQLAWKPVSEEAQIIAVLDAPRAEGEQFEVAFRRKEHELGALFAALSASDSLELQRRVGLKLAGDALAERFARLTNERRLRLIAFLVAARRRFAVVPREGTK